MMRLFSKGAIDTILFASKEKLTLNGLALFWSCVYRCFLSMDCVLVYIYHCLLPDRTRDKVDDPKVDYSGDLGERRIGHEPRLEPCWTMLVLDPLSAMWAWWTKLVMDFEVTVKHFDHYASILVTFYVFSLALIYNSLTFHTVLLVNFLIQNFIVVFLRV